MNITRANLVLLRNEEWYQFFAEFKRLALEHGVEELHIEVLFIRFLALLEDADTVLEQTRASELTAKIQKLDSERDKVFNGLRAMIKAFKSHFDPEKVEAATRLFILLKLYGYLSSKGYSHETAGLYNFIEDLKDKYAADINTLGIGDIVLKLEEINNEFGDVIMQRNEQQSTKTDLKMKDVRKELNTCYNEIINYLESYMTVNPEHGFEPFIKKLNTNIERYKNLLSRRKGRKTGNKTENSEADTMLDTLINAEKVAVIEQNEQTANQHQPHWTPIPPRDNDKPFEK